MQQASYKEQCNFLHQELKKYSTSKLIVKNDSFIKYVLLNKNLFIHVCFWVWAIWELWVVSAMLFPTNNSPLLQTGSAQVIFKSAFSYIYKIFKWSTDNYTTNTTGIYWFAESYIFLGFTFILLLLSVYTFSLVKNCTLDIKAISERIKFSALIKKINYFNTFWNIFITISLGFFAWLTFALIYVPQAASNSNDDSSSGNTVDTLLLIKNTSQWFPLTDIGIAVLAINSVIMGVIIKFYSQYCYERYINNEFYFSESRLYTPVKDKKEARKFNKKNNKSKLFTFIKQKFLVPNQPGYISEIVNANKIYYINNKPFYALKNINLNIKVGEFIVILGPSGSGKTTLVNILSGIDKPTSGKIILNGYNTMKMTDHQLNIFRRKNIGYVFQHYALLCNLTAKENISIASYLNKGSYTAYATKYFKENFWTHPSYKHKLSVIWKLIKDIFIDTNTEDVDKLLEILNLTEQANKYPHQLSGGQQQRVAIARALIKRPKILFGDETTGALDSDTARKILELFYLINKHSKTTVIMITHNPTIAEIADRVLYISKGEIVKDVINEKPKKISDLKNL